MSIYEVFSPEESFYSIIWAWGKSSRRTNWVSGIFLSKVAWIIPGVMNQKLKSSLCYQWGIYTFANWSLPPRPFSLSSWTSWIISSLEYCWGYSILSPPPPSKNGVSIGCSCVLTVLTVLSLYNYNAIYKMWGFGCDTSFVEENCYYAIKSSNNCSFVYSWVQKYNKGQGYFSPFFYCSLPPQWHSGAVHHSFLSQGLKLMCPIF